MLIDPELADPGNIWIVGEKSKIKNAEKELKRLINRNKILSSIFTSMDPMYHRFLREHCWDIIKEKEKSCNAEGVVVLDINANSLKVKGTKAGKNEMMVFLRELVKAVDFKVGRLFV